MSRAQAPWAQRLRRAAVAATRALALLGLAASSSAAWAAPLTGSRLDNSASAHYFDTDRGFNATIHSNTVSITVQPLDALTLTADNTVQRAPGGNAALSHRLSNTGNGPSHYLLHFANRSDDEHDLAGLRLVWDKNGNGVADVHEPELSSGALFGPIASGGRWRCTTCKASSSTSTAPAHRPTCDGSMRCCGCLPTR